MGGKSLAQARGVYGVLLLALALSGCATSSSRWELVAAGAALADIGSTGAGLERGGEEANSLLYGSSPSSGRMLAVNAGAYAGMWAMLRHQSPLTRQRAWRNVAVLRLAVTAWNLSQAGCFCFRFSF